MFLLSAKGDYIRPVSTQVYADRAKCLQNLLRSTSYKIYLKTVVAQRHLFKIYRN